MAYFVGRNRLENLLGGKSHRKVRTVRVETKTTAFANHKKQR
jgi:hypothetical protein